MVGNVIYIAAFKNQAGDIQLKFVDADYLSEAHLKAVELVRDQPLELIGFLQCLKSS